MPRRFGRIYRGDEMQKGCSASAPADEAAGELFPAENRKQWKDRVDRVEKTILSGKSGRRLV